MPSTNKIPIIAIIGKPNVGKSSLFNRLLRKRIAITSDIAGTTRDRIFFRTSFDEMDAILVDTGGLEFENKQDIEADMQSQARIAINQADLVLLVVDANQEPTTNDIQAIEALRKSPQNIIFIANKSDHPDNLNYLNWSQFGLGDPLPVSVIHNQNINELNKKVVSSLEKAGYKKALTQKKSNKIKIAFIGRPNAGKSTLINSIIKEERLITSSTPGTTRDAVDIDVEYNDQHFTLIDTAGLRRRGSIEKGIEKYSAMRSLDAIERADIVCLLMDYSVGIRALDQHICSYALEASKGLILIVNKIDLMDDRQEQEKRIINLLRRRFDFLSWAPVLFTSGIRQKNITKIFDQAQEIYQNRFQRIDHLELSQFLQKNYHKHYPGTVGRKKLLFYDMEQIGINPPKFRIDVNDFELIHFSYQRYLENEFRKQFGFAGTSIDFIYNPLPKNKLKKATPL